MPETYQLAPTPITAHAFNADRTQVCISPNSNEVQIFAKAPAAGGWQLKETLTDHDKIVTSIDWAPQTNRIVTCSQDRNAYVWNLAPSEDNPSVMTWQPTLVLLRLTRSATCVRWSPNEEKFAVGSGARTIAVCQFDEESNWWVAKHIKKPLRTTVLAIDWHPNSVLLAAGSADSQARVFSAFMKGVDSKPEPTVWGERLPFNTVCAEFASPDDGWVHAVAFSPSGDVLAFAAHDSTISLVTPNGPTHVINLLNLPILTLAFVSEDTLIGAGYDCQPFVFAPSGSAGEWAQTHSLDGADGASKASAASSGASAGGIGRLNKSEAFNMFRAADSRGVSSSLSPGGAGASQAGARVTNSGSTELLSVHQNTVTSVRLFGPNQVSTSGVDGKVVIWNVGSGGGVGAVQRGVGRMGI